MNVLSLFDGISCGQLALKKSGFNDVNYYASEINENSIKVTNSQFPNTIQLGDIEDLLKINDSGDIVFVGEKLKKLPKIDMLIGGSPCQGLSRAKTGRLNLKDPRSKLFFNYVKIRDWLIQNNNPDIMWLIENVIPSDKTLEIMNSVIGKEPYQINSRCFVPQDRERLYWTNIDVDLTKLPQDNHTIKEIMIDNTDEEVKVLNKKYEDTVIFTKNYIKWDTSGKRYYSQQNRARYDNAIMNTLTKKNSGDKTRIYLGHNENGYFYRNADIKELEKLQGLPVGYTEVLDSKIQRRGLVGDGWTVDVISWIFNFVK